MHSLLRNNSTKMQAKKTTYIRVPKLFANGSNYYHKLSNLHTSLHLPSYSQHQCWCCPNSSGEESEMAQGKQNLSALAMFPQIHCTTLFCMACAETPWTTEPGAFSRRWLSMAPGLILCRTIFSYGITDASAT